jgi:putative endonuclease
LNPLRKPNNKQPQLKQPSYTQGVKAEKQALLFLEQQGLTLVCQNYYCQLGEIDLIMIDDDTLVFIEVRYRKNSQFGGALASITPTKQKKIIKTARYYLTQYDDEPYCRFDAVAIESAFTQPMWLKDAFQE